jgi:hypothetical protein
MPAAEFGERTRFIRRDHQQRRAPGHTSCDQPDLVLIS